MDGGWALIVGIYLGSVWGPSGSILGPFGVRLGSMLKSDSGSSLRPLGDLIFRPVGPIVVPLLDLLLGLYWPPGGSRWAS